MQSVRARSCSAREVEGVGVIGEMLLCTCLLPGMIGREGQIDAEERE